MLVKTRQDKFILAVFTVWAFMKSFSIAQVIPLDHIDGAYQTASSLIRLDSNSALGKDFFPYLGIGPLIMHWPFFKLLGGSVAAAVSASQFLTLILLATSLSLSLHIILGKAPLRSFAIGSLVVMVSWYISRLALSPSELLTPFLRPGHSMRPIRASLPYVAGWLFIALRVSGFGRHIQTFLYSLVLGACLLWSNDYALPTALVFGIGWAFYVYTSHPYSFNSIYPGLANKFPFGFLRLGFLSRVILVFGLSLISYLIFLTILTKGHPIQFFKHNYFDIRSDQWWYFLPYEPHTRIFNLIDMPKIFLMSGNRSRLLFFLGISPFLLLIIQFRANLIASLGPNFLVFVLTGITLLFGGLLSCIGGHYEHGYISYFAFWGLSSSAIVLSSFFRNICDAGLGFYSQRRRIVAVFGLAVVPLLFGGVLIEAAKAVAHRRQLFDRPDYTYVSLVGGFMPKEYLKVFESIRPFVRRGGVQEEYFGLASAYFGSRGRYPVDSLIHLLGTLRKNNKSIALPEIVIVTNPTYSQWQSWSMSQNWWFYKKILGSYELFRSLPTIDVYKRKVGALPVATQKVVGCSWVPSDFSLVLDADAPPGLYSVSIKYTPMKGRGLILIENFISIPAYALGYVSIDPLAGASEFPVSKTGLVGVKMIVRLLGNFQNQPFEILECAAIRVASSRDRFLSGSYLNRVPGMAN
jgi:hypothetical protein